MLHVHVSRRAAQHSLLHPTASVVSPVCLAGGECSWVVCLFFFLGRTCKVPILTVVAFWSFQGSAFSAMLESRFSACGLVSFFLVFGGLEMGVRSPMAVLPNSGGGPRLGKVRLALFPNIFRSGLLQTLALVFVLFYFVLGLLSSFVVFLGPWIYMSHGQHAHA